MLSILDVLTPEKWQDESVNGFTFYSVTTSMLRKSSQNLKIDVKSYILNFRTHFSILKAEPNTYIENYPAATDMKTFKKRRAH